MFDKTFLKFAIAFGAVIAISLGSLYVTGLLQNANGDAQAAAVRK